MSVLFRFMFDFDVFPLRLSKFLPSVIHLKYPHSARGIVKYHSAKFPFVFSAILYVSRAALRSAIRKSTGFCKVPRSDGSP